jgi:hypothetical protein
VHLGGKRLGVGQRVDDAAAGDQAAVAGFDYQEGRRVTLLFLAGGDDELESVRMGG